MVVFNLSGLRRHDLTAWAKGVSMAVAFPAAWACGLRLVCECVHRRRWHIHGLVFVRECTWVALAGEPYTPPWDPVEIDFLLFHVCYLACPITSAQQEEKETIEFITMPRQKLTHPPPPKPIPSGDIANLKTIMRLTNGYPPRHALPGRNQPAVLACPRLSRQLDP